MLRRIMLFFEKKPFSLTLFLAFFWSGAGAFLHTLTSSDETRVCGISLAMLLENDALLPRLNGTPFVEYPPLFYHLEAAAFRLFGYGEQITPIVPALISFLTVLLLYRTARKMNFSAMAAAVAAFLLMSSGGFVANRAEVRVDGLLTLCCLISIDAFVSLLHAENRRGKILAGIELFAGLAAGAYTKGILGAALPLAIAGTVLIVRDVMRREISFEDYVVAAVAALSAAVLYLAYFYLLYLRYGYDIFHEAFFVNNFGRFSGSQGDHVSPFYGYIVKLPELFPPYIPLVLAGIFFQTKRLFKNKCERSADTLLSLVAVIVPFLAFSIAASKRMVYLLPIAPYAALLSAGALFDLIALTPSRFRTAVRAFYERHRSGAFLLIAFSCILINVIFYIAMNVQKKNASVHALYAECTELEKAGYRICIPAPIAERSAGAAVFYLHHRVPSPDPRTLDVQAKEVWIVRRKGLNIGKSFPDSHYLLTTPEEKSAYLAFLKK